MIQFKWLFDLPVGGVVDSASRKIQLAITQIDAPRWSLSGANRFDLLAFKIASRKS